MKKVLLILCLYGTPVLHAQQCQWAKTAGGATGDACLSVAIDTLGNSYTAGFFTGVVDFGFGQVISMGEKDAFVLKRDPFGNAAWLRVFSGSGEEEIRDVVVAEDGSLYVVGWFDSPLLFCGAMIPLTNVDTATQNSLLVRLDASGFIFWAKQSTGAGNEQFFSVACDAVGNAYVAGGYYDTLQLDSLSLVSVGSRDVCIAGYDTSGSLLFASSGGSVHDDVAYGIACDPYDRCIVITGYFNFGAIQIDTARFGTETIQSIGYTDIFLARYDLLGNCEWARAAGGTSFGDAARGVVISDSGRMFIAGYFSGTAVFGSNTLSTASTADAFVASYDSSGNCLWATALGSVPQGNSVAYDIALENTQNPIVVGGFEREFLFGQKLYGSSGWYDGFIASFAYATGAPYFAMSTGGIDEDWLCGVSVDSNGTYHVGGISSSVPTYFGSCTVSTYGQTDAYEAKCSLLSSGVTSYVRVSPVQVYPNPFFTECHIELLGNFTTLTLVDIYGREVRHITSQVDGTVTLDRRDLPSGAYCLIVVCEDGTLSTTQIFIH
ncbi:MAG: T9SS type A sorting domain-containing protein [Candidatus Pacebacteria bacterium]|jgi:hypothetical protein|nr:T9SS type A sorting domain-containing protein [Candidatus Paceibacterota bacterium]